MNIVTKITCLLLATFSFSVTTNLYAADASWHEETQSYKVYLGIVSANLIKNNLYLVDRDKSLHGNISEKTSNDKHLLVSVYRKKNNERVTNATIIGEIKHKKLLGGNKIRKPLEKMVTSGTITYGNFFKMGEQGTYEINIEIFESDKNGSEHVTFIQKQ